MAEILNQVTATALQKGATIVIQPCGSTVDEYAQSIKHSLPISFEEYDVIIADDGNVADEIKKCETFAGCTVWNLKIAKEFMNTNP